MKKFYLSLVLLVLAVVGGSAQVKNVVFSGDGKLTQVPLNLKKGDTVTNAQIIVAELDKWESRQKNKLKAELAAAFSLSSTIVVQPSNDLAAFYKWLWNGQPGAAQVAAYYKLRATQLKNVPFSFTPDPNFKDLDDILDTFFLASHKLYKIESDKADAHNFILKLKVTNVSNEFLLSLFQKTTDNPENADFRILEKETYLQMSQGLKRQSESLNSFLVLSRTILDYKEVNEFFLNTNRLLQAHQSFESYAGNGFLFKLLRKPWMKSWIWRYNGKIGLNPLPFTDENLLTDSPVTDSLKISYFTQYITNSIHKRIKQDSIADMPAFIKDVAFVGKEKALATDSAGYKQIRTKNKQQANVIQLVTQAVNEIRIPYYKSDHEYLQYLNPDQDEFVYQDKIKPITTETNVLASVYNVPQKDKVELVKIKDVAGKDVSATQAGIDFALDGLNSSLVSAVLPTIKSFPVVEGSNEQILTRPDSAAIEKVNELVHLTGPQKFILRIIMHHSYFNKDILHFAGYEYPYYSLLNNIISAHPNLAENPKEKDVTVIVDRYFETLLKTKVIPPLVTLLKKDSIYLEQAHIILSNSSLPPHSVTAKADETPQFKTVQRFTELDDSVKEFTYVLKRYSTKDTVTFGKFAYKTGRIHYIQLSAGLAYTFDDVTTNTLDKTGSQISITSASQQYRFYAGVHVYPAGLFMLDGFAGGKKHWTGRINIMAGVGIPKPIDNIYLGLGYDFGPAIRLTGGVHFHSYTRYQVSNDMVTGETKIYKTSLPFISLGINPASLVKALTLFSL